MKDALLLPLLRLLAFLIDLTVVFAAVCVFILLDMVDVIPSPIPRNWAAMIICIAYFGLAERIDSGQTLGKRLCGIRRIVTGLSHVSTFHFLLRAALFWTLPVLVRLTWDLVDVIFEPNGGNSRSYVMLYFLATPLIAQCASVLASGGSSSLVDAIARCSVVRTTSGKLRRSRWMLATTGMLTLAATVPLRELARWTLDDSNRQFTTDLSLRPEQAVLWESPGTLGFEMLGLNRIDFEELSTRVDNIYLYATDDLLIRTVKFDSSVHAFTFDLSPAIGRTPSIPNGDLAPKAVVEVYQPVTFRGLMSSRYQLTLAEVFCEVVSQISLTDSSVIIIEQSTGWVGEAFPFAFTVIRKLVSIGFVSEGTLYCVPYGEPDRFLSLSVGTSSHTMWP